MKAEAGDVFDFSGVVVRVRGVPDDVRPALLDLWRRFRGEAAAEPLVDVETGDLAQDLTPGGAMAPGLTSRRDAGRVVFGIDEGTIAIEASGRSRAELKRGEPGRRTWGLANLVLAAVGWRIADLPGAALHAASIVLDGRAFVLVGPEGCGKTSWCREAERAGARVLSDDVSLLDLSADPAVVLGAPFRHRPFPEPPRGRWPLAMLLLPEHAPRADLRPVARLALEARLAANLLYASAVDEAGAERAGRIVAMISERVPARTLAFGLDPSFADVLRRA